MSIQEVKDATREAEEKIRSILNDLERTTECHVSNIEFHRIEGMYSMEIIELNIDLKV